MLGGQTNEWRWANTSVGLDEEWGKSIARDINGNIYVTGNFSGTAYFGTHSVTCQTTWPNYNIFVAKMDPAGEWVWAVSAGSASHSNAYSIGVDDFGGVYITGFFYDDFYAGPLSVSSVGECDAYFAKLDSEGFWIWLYRGGGVLGNDIGNDIAIDPIGLVYFVGEYYGTATFYDQTLISNGENDAFIVCIDTDGTWMGASTVGGTSWDEGFGIAVGPYGEIAITGRFMGEMTLGGDTIQTHGSNDVFVAMRNSSGWQWLRRGGGNSYDFGRDVVMDEDGNCYVTGGFSTTADFGPHTLYAGGAIDVFVARLDLYGNWEWCIGAYGGGEDYVFGIGLDGDGNIYIGGLMRYTLRFDYNTLHSAGDDDGFLARIDPSGLWQWAFNIGYLYMDSVRGITVDEAGNVYSAGYYQEFLNLGDFFITDDLIGIWVGKYGPGDVTLPVELSSFSVSPLDNLSALLQWTTQSETGLLGFNVLRHVDDTLDQATVINSSLIMDGVSLGSQTTYSYQDAELGPETSYYYWLESVDMGGNSQFFGPQILRLDDPSQDPVPPTIPAATALLDAYPNPFNPSTTLRYSLKTPGTVKISIHNLKGQLVKTFRMDHALPGYYQIPWDGRDLKNQPVSSGVYIYEMRAGKIIDSKKMIMAK